MGSSFILCDRAIVIDHPSLISLAVKYKVMLQIMIIALNATKFMMDTSRLCALCALGNLRNIDDLCATE